jgi:hypothetical protein
MTIMKKYLFLITVSLFISCSENKEAKNNSSLKTVLTPAHVDNPNDSIGEYHNALIDYAFTNCNFDSLSMEVQIDSLVYYFEESEVVNFNGVSTDENFQSFFESIVSFPANGDSIEDYVDLSDLDTNSAEDKQMLRIVTILTADNPPADIIENLKLFEDSILDGQISLTEDQQSNILSMASIARHSIKLWFEDYNELDQRKLAAETILVIAAAVIDAYVGYQAGKNYADEDAPWWEKGLTGLIYGAIASGLAYLGLG